jgi:hypothetical protein
MTEDYSHDKSSCFENISMSIRSNVSMFETRDRNYKVEPCTYPESSEFRDSAPPRLRQSAGRSRWKLPGCLSALGVADRHFLTLARAVAGCGNFNVDVVTPSLLSALSLLKIPPASVCM